MVHLSFFLLRANIKKLFIWLRWEVWPSKLHFNGFVFFKIGTDSRGALLPVVLIRREQSLMATKLGENFFYTLSRTCLNLCVPCTIGLQSKSIPYLQSYWFGYPLVGLAAKHRQLARQIGVLASSSANSMATFAFNTTVLHQGTTFVFSSYVCVANGSGSFWQPPGQL